MAAILVVTGSSSWGASLADIGASAPTPGASDISQLLNTGGNSSTDGLNYYDNNNPAGGQTFTTGANASGYTLGNLAYQYYTSGSGSSHSGSQTYTLRIYAVGAGASLLASYSASAAVTSGDWVKWTGLSVALQPNTTYAYTVICSSGYQQFVVASGSPYAGGEIVQISTNGAAGVAETIATGSTHNFDAAFDVGLTLGGATTVANSDMWNGGSVNGENWNDPANWNGSNPSPNDFLSFSGSAQTSPNNNFTSYTFGSIVFQPSAVASFTLGGNSVTLGNSVQDSNGNLYGGGIWNLATNLTQTVDLGVTLSPGNHVIGSGSGGQLALAGATSRSTGTTVQFFNAGGGINTTGSGLANDSSPGGGILGGWAVIGTGNDAGNWATLSSGNVVAYSSYTSESGSFTTTAGGNFKVTQNNSTCKITAASGSYVDMNTLLCNPGTSHGETIEANTASQPLRLGPYGAIMNIDGNSQTITVGGGSTYGLTAGGATTSNPAELTLIQLGSGSGHLIINSVIQNNGSGAITLNQLGSVNYNDANTYTGGTYLNLGECYFAGGSSVNVPFGSGPIYVYPGARLDLGGDNTATIANSIYLSGNGSYEAGANNPAALKGSYNGTFSGLITLLGNAQVDPNAGGLPNTCTFSGGFAGTGSLTIGGANVDTAGNATFGGNCTYTGDTIIDASANKNGGAGIIIFAGANNIMNNGGNLNLIGGSTGVALFDLNGTTQTINGLANTSGTAANAIVQSSSGSGTLVVGNSNASTTFTGIIQNGAGTASLVKIGTGTLTLGGADTYGGSTSVSNGTLVVNGSIASGGGVTVTGATLGGAGTVSGATTFLPNAILAAGKGGIGTLSFGSSLTLNADSTNDFVVTTAGGASNKVAVAGLLTPDNSIISITSGTPLYPSTNLLFTYGTSSGVFTATPVFDVAPVHPASIVDNGSGQVSLVVPNHPPAAGPSFSLGATVGVPATVQIIDGKYSPTDPDGDALTITNVSGATNGTVTTDGTNVTYTPTGGTADSFTYTVSDPYGATASQTVLVVINPAGQSYNQVSAQSIGGQAVLTYYGIPNYQYALDWTHSLTPPIVWTPLLTNEAADNGELLFTNAPSGGTDFYRTRYVTP